MKEEAILKKLNEMRGLKSPELEGYIDKWIEDIKYDIALASAKSVGFGSGLKSIKKIASNNKKLKPELAYVLKSSKKDVFVVTDGFTGVSMRGSQGLDTTSLHTDVADNTIRFIESYEKSCTKGVQLPLRSTLDTIIKEWKAEPKKERRSFPLYDFGEGLPQFDAQKLIDILAIFPTQLGYVSASSGKTSPLYLTYENYQGILMPVRK